jgi:hypothetical protein
MKYGKALIHVFERKKSVDRYILGYICRHKRGGGWLVCIASLNVDTANMVRGSKLLLPPLQAVHIGDSQSRES